MRHVIESVERGSAAYRHGLRAGDALISLNGEAIVDEIDYQALIAGSRVHAVVERDGREVAVDIRKQEGEPLGLHFGPEMALSPRTCRNNCVFCFIRQMPPGLRKTLYVRDDDWRFSLMMGNFVTLTNVDDAEFDRHHPPPCLAAVCERACHRSRASLPDDEQPLRGRHPPAPDAPQGCRHPIPLPDCGVPRLERRRAAAQNAERPACPCARGTDGGHGARGPHALS